MMIEPQVSLKPKTTRRTRNIAVLVLIVIVLLSTLLYFTITRVLDKADQNQPDQAMVQEFQDQLPDEPDLGSSSQEIQTEQSKVSEKPVAKKEVKPAQSPVKS